MKVEKLFSFPCVSDAIRVQDGNRAVAWLWPQYENGEVVSASRLAELASHALKAKVNPALIQEAIDA